MTSASRIAITALGSSLSAFFVITYVLCIIYGLAFADQGFHCTLMPMLLPGFSWLTWSAFFIGLAWVFAFGWYVALIFTPLYNFFAARSDALRST
jgi:hypothetical protein